MKWNILQTDLYQLTMMAAYFDKGMNPISTFEMFVRKLPSNRDYLVFSGLSLVLDALEELSFTKEDISFLREHPSFKHLKEDFFSYLENFKFSGEVWSVPEGEIVFEGMPLIRVTAPLLEAQLIETLLLSVINMSTMISSKASRIVDAAKGKSVVEFGSRRAHGPEAGLLAARASYIGGCDGTSNVEAGRLFNIPIVGTCAHSFIMSFEKEEDAFKAYVETFPENAVLLIDTYDTLHGAYLATQATKDLKGVRLDSGDLADLSKKVRKILNDNGHPRAKIIVSNDLNEEKIKELLDVGAPIDVFGVGTEMVTSKDAPALGGVYKLVSQQRENGEFRDVIKNSVGKPSYPSAKQVWRVLDKDNRYVKDIVCQENEKDVVPPYGNSTELLTLVMKGGRSWKSSEKESQQYCRNSKLAWPENQIKGRVIFSGELEKRRDAVLASL